MCAFACVLSIVQVKGYRARSRFSKSDIEVDFRGPEGASCFGDRSGVSVSGNGRVLRLCAVEVHSF